MNIFKRTIQGGALRTFVIVAVVLAIVTVAAVVVVQQRGETVRREQAIQAADEAIAAAESKDREVAVVENTDADDEPTPPVTGNDEPSELPATGPESVLIDLLAAVLLAGTISLYLSSRREVARSL